MENTNNKDLFMDYMYNALALYLEIEGLGYEFSLYDCDIQNEIIEKWFNIGDDLIGKYFAKLLPNK